MEFKVTWDAKNWDDKPVNGELGVIRSDENEAVALMEERMFEEIEQRQAADEELRLSRVTLRVEAENGSGRRLNYKRSGRTWIRTHNEAMVPNWFPFVVLGIFFFVLIVVPILCAVFRFPI